MSLPIGCDAVVNCLFLILQGQRLAQILGEKFLKYSLIIKSEM